MGVKVGDKVVLEKYPHGENGLPWMDSDLDLIGQTVMVSGFAPDGNLEFDDNTWAKGYFHSVSTVVPVVAPTPTKHSHYFKSVKGLDHIDVYRVLQLFNVTDPCIQHAVKKLLVAGGRGAGKDINRDIQESIDTLVRWQEMQTEGVTHAPTV